MYKKLIFIFSMLMRFASTFVAQPKANNSGVNYVFGDQNTFVGESI